MKWITSIAALSICALDAQESPDQSDDGELSVGIPTVPKTPNQIDIYQKNGSMSYSAAKGEILYTGDFQLRSDTGLEILAKQAALNLAKQEILLTGNVSIFQNGLFQQGDQASFNLKNQSLSSSGLKVNIGHTQFGHLLLEAGNFKSAKDKNGNNYFIGEHAGVTTDDVSQPNFWVRSDVTKVYPNDRVTFKNLKFYVGKTPIFWLPYLSQPLDPKLGYHFIPGTKSNWGGYLLNSYGFMVGKGTKSSVLSPSGKPWLLAQAVADIRLRRGLGIGLNLEDTRQSKNTNLSGFKFYYLNDLAPQTTRSGLERGFVNEDRYKLELKHRLNLASNSFGETYFDSNLSFLSDKHFREDFAPKLYTVDPEPSNTLSLIHRKNSLLAGISANLRLNSFYQTDTRLPEVFVDYLKSPVLNTSLLYEGSASIGKYREWLTDSRKSTLSNELLSLPAGDPRTSEINTLLSPTGYNRFHTFHEFSLPLQPSKGVGLVPHLSLGHTNYWSINSGLDSFDRTHFQAGLDFSMKFAKRYHGIENKKWGLDGIMHVAQPYANYTHLTTDALDPSFQPIDRLTPTTELRPIKVGRFSAIDQLNDWSIFRLGLRNNLITKRDGGAHTWLTMNSYIDVFFNDPEFNRDISNFYNDISWHPLPWAKFDLEAQFPLSSDESGFSEYSTRATFMPSPSTEFSVGYRYLNSHPSLSDSSLVDLRSYTRFNEKWGASFYQSWELDDGTLETQQYSVHRDLGSWSAALGFLQRNNRIKKEYGLRLSFTLKEFPSFSLPVSIDAP